VDTGILKVATRVQRRHSSYDEVFSLDRRLVVVVKSGSQVGSISRFPFLLLVDGYREV
jgi:hypothetical protein